MDLARRLNDHLAALYEQLHAHPDAYFTAEEEVSAQLLLRQVWRADTLLSACFKPSRGDATAPLLGVLPIVWICAAHPSPPQSLDSTPTVSVGFSARPSPSVRFARSVILLRIVPMPCFPQIIIFLPPPPSLPPQVPPTPLPHPPPTADELSLYDELQDFLDSLPSDEDAVVPQL